MSQGEFNPLTVPLRGTHLVEAGAGTGKTHGLTALVLRLLVEGAVVPEQLALVTFTDAATRELRARARTRLALLAERLAGRAPRSDDAQVEALVERHANDDAARRRVEVARMSWDDATVATIHGFCRRLLGDFSLETGASFTDVEPSDGSQVMQRAIEDFWRRHVVSAEPAQAEWVLSWCETPGQLLELLKDPLRVPATSVIPDCGPADLEAIERELDGLAAAGTRLQRSGAIPALLAELDAHPHLSQAKASPYLRATLATTAAALAECFAGHGPRGFRDVTVAHVRTLSRAAIVEGTFPKKRDLGWLPEPAAVLDWADAVCAGFARHARVRRVAFLRGALDEVRGRLDQHRRDRRIVTFDDLVRDTAQLLAGSGGIRARDAIRARLKVAVVDEFQDTDAEQYAIFRALFHGRSDGALFLVGDPKQAIYRFRGGDVFAYAQAADDAGANGWSLTANWRSDERLIDAVNGLFDDSRRMPAPAFVHEFIRFERARFGAPRRRAPALPPIAQPLTVWTFDTPEPLTKGAANDRVDFAIAAEIARLRREFPGARLRIAVLARTWRELASCAAELSRWRIASTQSSARSVFDGSEADALRVVLESLADLRDVRKARAALTGELIGFDEATLRGFADGAQEWDLALALLVRFAAIAGEDGPAALVRALAQHAGPRWLAQADGSRRLSTLVQLGEVLQCECGAGAGIAAQVVALERRASGPASPDAELRPEVGTDAVELLTVHKSKGLEWDVVFAPYLWSGRDEARDNSAIRAIRPVRFHRERGGLLVDIGSEERDAHRERALQEAYAESMRLAYVALTRARCRAYTAWFSANTAEDSPFAWLLHQKDGAGTRGMNRPPSSQAVHDRLGEWRDAARDAIAIVDLPEVGDRDPLADATSPTLVARAFRGHIDRRFAMLSYSALFGEGGEEQPDHDQRAPALAAPEPGPVPDTPRGPRFGECVHQVLEKYDFAEPESQDNLARIAAIVREEFRFDEDVEQYVIELAGSVARAAPLGGATLAGMSRRYPELEFFFPLEDVDLAAVRSALAREPRYERSAADFARLRPRWHGLMHGYIDLVFADGDAHGLLDYKTNYLGGRVEDYEGESLARAVRAADYDLQYLIYSVALVRHLRRRHGARFDYDRHFGGVSYLFLRGLEGGAGVYRDKPPRAVIDALDRAFGGSR